MAAKRTSLLSKLVKQGAVPRRLTETDKSSSINIDPPAHWQAHLENIRTMRAKRDAPVDLLGCEVLADPAAEARIQQFHVLVALMLSSQTRDEQTAAATRRLQALPGGLTPRNIIKLPEATIAETIQGVGFWRRKATYLKVTSQALVDNHDGCVPASLKELCQLPGVGMKMAQITMAVAHKKPVGLGVDSHCHRVMNRLGWCQTQSPEATRQAVEAWLPPQLWGELNLLLVGFGQQVCQPRRPRCQDCSNRALCPYEEPSPKPKAKKSKELGDKKSGKAKKGASQR
eukprot:m.42003 g.42003  ORF g.42003 m.42003 type:complete len:286 (+) comp12847_c0_seq1:82-939(+)